jgi:hypothetical protein
MGQMMKGTAKSKKSKKSKKYKKEGEHEKRM